MAESTMAHVNRLLASARSRVVGRGRELAESPMERLVHPLVRTAEVVGTAGALAYAEGRYGEMRLLGSKDNPKKGVDGILVAGLAAKAAAVFVGGRIEKHANAVGDGALALVTAKYTHKMGVEAASKTTTSGYPQIVGRDPNAHLTPAERAAMSCR